MEYILERRHTIESDFIQMLIDRINQSNIDLPTREHLTAKINQLSTNLRYVDRFTNTRISFNANNDSDEEPNDDYEPDDTDIEFDYCDDLENELLDEIELQQDYNTY
ncbi:unnamed protein product [Adineta steineri]|uniref:Uncharacterized protein n=2 Tax=Adineta steineri TaxID=433720 RepID=A0A815QLF8_9BILA|nr:unnamed protein product [Adineta steineri]